MAPVDSLLRLVLQQGADELRLGSDTAPRMFARGTQGRLTVPETSDATLRVLLAPLLTDDSLGRLVPEGSIETPYVSDNGTLFDVTVSARLGVAGGSTAPLDVVFRKRDTTPPAAAATPSESSMQAATPAGSLATPRRPAPTAWLNDVAAPRDARHPLGPAPTWPELLRYAARVGASDLHLRTGEAPVVRVEGTLQPAGPSAVDVRVLLGELLNDTQQNTINEGGSIDFAYALDAARFRVNVYRASGQWATSVRLLAQSAPELASLRLPVDLRALAGLPGGLVVVCGPTGAGKSTTLAALAREALCRRSVVLLTLEDPIEYGLSAEGTTSLVRQREVGHDVRDFATGLRDALREDPDVLLVGEMRDATSMGLALTAAETGHLVLTTLHSGSAASAMERMVDAYAPERQRQIRTQLAGTLRAVIVQRLLPRAHGNGRVAAVEVLRGTHGVANLVREGKTAQLTTAMQAGRADGMVTLERSLADLVQTGEVHRDDALAAANDPEALSAYLAR